MSPIDISLVDIIGTSIVQISTGTTRGECPEDFVIPLHDSPYSIALRTRHAVMCDPLYMLNAENITSFNVYHGPIQPEANELQLWQKDGDIQAIFPMANMIQMPTLTENPCTAVMFAQLLVRRNPPPPLPWLPAAVPLPAPAPTVQNIAVVSRRLSPAHGSFITHRLFHRHQRQRNVGPIVNAVAPPQTPWVMPPRKKVPPFKFPRRTVLGIVHRYLAPDLVLDEGVGLKRKCRYEEDDLESPSKRPALYLVALSAGLLLNHMLR